MQTEDTFVGFRILTVFPIKTSRTKDLTPADLTVQEGSRDTNTYHRSSDT